MTEYPLKPMLMHKGQKPFDDKDFIFEFKFDGVRCLSYNLDGKIQLFNRKLNPRTHLYPEIISALKFLPDGIILDGELIAIEDGCTNFYKILERDLAKIYRPDKINVGYMVFDILMHNNKNVMDLSLNERRKILESLKLPKNSPIQISPVFSTGTLLFETAQNIGQEGIVAKRRSSIYQPDTRTYDWLKIKCIRDMDVTIGGFSQKARPTLAVGIENSGKLQYIGNVGNGLTQKEWARLVSVLESIKTDINPFSDMVKNDSYVLPVLKLNLKYLEFEEGKLRQPVINKIYYNDGDTNKNGTHIR